MIPPASVPDVPERPKHRAAKKPAAPPVAKDTPTPEPSEAAVAPSDAKAGSAHIVDLPPAKAVATPVKPVASPEPTNQAKVETPKPSAPRIVGEPLNQPKSEDKPAPKTEAPKSAPAQAKIEEKPKAEAPRKKLNDLPVGTLD
jgi:hypothetical protein